MIDIIIINYNCAKHLQELLKSLTENKDTTNHYFDFSITVVDNASSDGSQGMVENQYPDVSLVSNPENLGYSSAVNMGITSTHHRTILLLNSDILMTSDEVASLYRVWKRLDFPAIIGPMHYEEDDYPQQTWGEFPNHENELKRRKLEHAATQRENWAKRELQNEASRTREVTWVSGSCMMFARSTAADIGEWDENYFLFFEDIDWCLRAKEFDLSIYHTPEVQIQHAHGASVNVDPDTTEIEYRFSQMYFTKKHLGTLAFWNHRFYLTGKNLWRWIIGNWSGFERSTSFEILKETWKSPGV